MTPLENPDLAAVPNYRALKAAVILLGILILLALGILVGGMLLGKGPGGNATRQAAPYLTTLPAAIGAHIVESRIDGNRLLVTIGDQNGDSLVVIEAATGEILGRVTLEVEP